MHSPATMRAALELARLERPSWPELLELARLEGPTAALLETMHIEGQDYTFKQLRDYIEKGVGASQEGVYGANDYLVAQRAAGANMSVDVAGGDAWVKMDTGTRNGLYFQTNDATVNVPVTAAHATLPRIDQVYLQVNDSNVVGGSNNPTLGVLAGTPTSGATLANRLGAAALGNDRLLLGDILVPAASASVTNANIKDRRPHARGPHLIAYRAAAVNVSTSLGTVVFDTVEEAVPASAFDVTTGKWSPQTPGVYRLNTRLFTSGNATDGVWIQASIYKNGTTRLATHKDAVGDAVDEGIQIDALARLVPGDTIEVQAICEGVRGLTPGRDTCALEAVYLRP